MKCDLSGKVSLVTGAARGIGQAIGDRFAANGSFIYYTDLVAEEAQAAAARTPNGRGLRLDVTKPDEIAAVVHFLASPDKFSPSKSEPWNVTSLGRFVILRRSWSRRRGGRRDPLRRGLPHGGRSR